MFEHPQNPAECMQTITEDANASCILKGGSFGRIPDEVSIHFKQNTLGMHINNDPSTTRSRAGLAV